MNIQPVGNAGYLVWPATDHTRESVEVKLPGGGGSVESPIALAERELQQTLKDLPEEKLTQVARFLNQTVAVLDIEAKFSVHEKTREIMVTLINRDTKEVVRQIPPEKVLDMLAQLKELVGILFDEVI